MLISELNMALFMFALLSLVASRSFLIPSELTNKLLLKTGGLDIAIEESKKPGVKLVIALSSTDNITYFAQQFALYSTLYNESIRFVLSSYRDMRMLLGVKTPMKPCILTFVNGECKDYMHVRNDAYLANAIDNLIQPYQVIATTQEQMIRRLGTATATVLTTRKNYEVSANAARLGCRMWGTVDTQIISQDLARNLGFSEKECAVYRFDDKNIAKYNCTFEGLQEQLRPNYRIFERTFLRHTDRKIVAFFLPRLTEEHRNFLDLVGGALNKVNDEEFALGIIDQEDLPEYVQMYGINNFGIDNFLVFNQKNGYVYPTEPFYNSVESKKVNYRTWTAQFVNYLINISKGEITPIFYSEPRPEEPEGTPLHKLSSVNYKQFIYDDEMDAVVFYVRPYCDNCRRFFPYYVNFTNMWARSPLGNVKFGFIDISRNGINGTYPARVSDPHFVLFRHGERDPHGIPLLDVFDGKSLRRAVLLACSEPKVDARQIPPKNPSWVNESVTHALYHYPSSYHPSIRRGADLYLESLKPIEEKNDEL